MTSRSFFGTVGRHSGLDTENQVRNTLVACLSASSALRRRFITSLSRAAGTKSLGIRDMNEAQLVIAPSIDGRYPDLVVTSHEAWRWAIECKVSAPDNLGQLITYQKLISSRHPGCRLVYLTKTTGNIPRAVLQKHGIARMRWQDIHLLCDAFHGIKDSRDAFLAAELAKYLEEQKMAHSVAIAYEGVKAAAGFLHHVRNPSRGNGGIVRQFEPGLATMTQLSYVLSDVREGLISEFDEARRFKVWGPGYWARFSDEDDGVAPGHRIAVTLYFRKLYEWRNSLRFGFFLDHAESTFYAGMHVDGRELPEQETRLRKLCRKSSGELRLQTDQLVAHVVAYWKEHRRKCLTKRQ